jgi:hypothetical protein
MVAALATAPQELITTDLQLIVNWKKQETEKRLLNLVYGSQITGAGCGKALANASHLQATSEAAGMQISYTWSHLAPVPAPAGSAGSQGVTPETPARTERHRKTRDANEEQIHLPSRDISFEKYFEK